jgi:hypothetical protein
MNQTVQTNINHHRDSRSQDRYQRRRKELRSLQKEPEEAKSAKICFLAWFVQTQDASQ